MKVQKLNPTAQVIFDDKLTVDHTGDEKTAVRFRLDAEGKVMARYGSGIYLVRPDQHVAARWKAADAKDIQAALSRCTAHIAA